MNYQRGTSVPSRKHACTGAHLETGAVRKELIFGLVIVIIAAVIIVFGVLSPGARKRIIKEGDVAPAFTLPATDTSSVRLKDYRGKVVLVHFWATWCTSCVKELPELERLYRLLRGPEFEVLAVSVDDDVEKSVLPFLKKTNVTFPVLLDTETAVSRSYGTYKFPETYVLDKTGTVRFKVIGPIEWTSRDTVTALQRLISER